MPIFIDPTNHIKVYRQYKHTVDYAPDFYALLPC